MNITDFLPIYPYVKDSEFETNIYLKKEFHDNILEKIEPFPNSIGMMTKYQTTIARYLSINTPYDKLILFHSMGTGKTCSVINAIELSKAQQNFSEGGFAGAIILAKGDQIINNWKTELVEKCTIGQYIPKGWKKLTDLEKTKRINKKIDYYEFNTFIKFGKKIGKIGNDEMISKLYDNHIIVIDEVHNLRIQDADIGGIETYNNIHRFLHAVKNCKIVFLSGTPMKDTPDEIATISNLLLPVDDQFPVGQNFIQEYLTEDGKMRPEKIMEFKERMKGKVSFLKEMESTVKKVYLGERFDNLILYPCKMSDFQKRAYEIALRKDGSERSIYSNAREANLFVYPPCTDDEKIGCWGSDGFSRFIKEIKTEKMKKTKTGKNIKTVKKSFKMGKELTNMLVGRDRQETLSNIYKHSSVYGACIEKILSTKGNCFIYNSSVMGSGCILLSLILELFGFEKAVGKPFSKKPRYLLITGTDNTKLDNLVGVFNSPQNRHGEIIQVIIGSKKASEGLSFRNVIFECILTPWWNLAETSQAIARGIRLNSHANLPSNTVVEIMLTVGTSGNEPTDNDIDFKMYSQSQKKDVPIKHITRLLMEVAFDCELNKKRNMEVGSANFSRECDYSECDYKCDGIVGDISELPLDYSTFQLYYSNPKPSKLTEKIEMLLTIFNKLTIKEIAEKLPDYTEEEIYNTLYVILDGKEEITYVQFKEKYSKMSNVQEIQFVISQMFRNSFLIPFSVIEANLESFTRFEILTALSEIVSKNSIITDKYGFSCYLREKDNIYFLSPNLSNNNKGESVNISDVYYVENKSVKNEIPNFEKKLVEYFITEKIMELKSVRTVSQVKKIVEFLPLDLQEFLIETAVIVAHKGMDSIVSNNILEHYSYYIKVIENITYSLFPREYKSSVRCFFDGEWKNCSDVELESLNQEIREKQKSIEDNMYGIVGYVNGQEGDDRKFCIKVIKEDTGDARQNTKGIVCKTIPKSKIIDFVVKNLGLKARVGYMATDRAIDNLSDREDFEDLTDDQKVALVYYTNAGYTSQNLCDLIEQTLSKKGLVSVDKSCGSARKKQDVVGSVDEKKETSYAITEINPIAKPDEWAYYRPLLENEYKNFYGSKQSFSPDDRTWVILRTSRGTLTIFGSVVKRNEKWELEYIGMDSKYAKRKNDRINAKAAFMRHVNRKYEGITFSVPKSINRPLLNKYVSLGFIYSISGNFYNLT